jgi:hypothetical protein
MKKKAKRKKPGQALTAENATAIENILNKLTCPEEGGDPVAASLQEIHARLGVSVESDVALVDALGAIPTERAAKLLQSLLGSTTDKRVLKAVKRSLYRIEQRGVRIQPVDKPKREHPVLRPPPEEQTRGFISAVDSEGSQIFFLTIPRKPKGLYLLQGIVNETRGLTEFNRVETTKKGFREFYQSLKEPEQLTVVEVDPGYCRFRLEQATELNRQRGAALPASYLASNRDFQKLGRHETPPALLLLDKKEIEADPRILKNSPDLFQIQPFSSWFLPREEVEKYAELLEEAEESRLVLNPAQKEARLQETYRKALVELFPEERRSLYQRRLEEMAYVLLKGGQEGRARAALAASLDMEPALTGLEPNPFLLSLVIRSIYAVVSVESEKKKTEPSLLVKP